MGVEQSYTRREQALESERARERERAEMRERERALARERTRMCEQTREQVREDAQMRARERARERARAEVQANAEARLKAWEKKIARLRVPYTGKYVSYAAGFDRTSFNDTTLADTMHDICTRDKWPFDLMWAAWCDEYDNVCVRLVIIHGGVDQASWDSWGHDLRESKRCRTYDENLVWIAQNQARMRLPLLQLIRYDFESYLQEAAKFVTSREPMLVPYEDVPANTYLLPFEDGPRDARAAPAGEASAEDYKPRDGSFLLPFD